MAATIGTWAAFTNGSDPSGLVSIDAGSNRKLILAVMGETDLGSLSITVTIGGQAPSETVSLDLELGSGAADIAMRAFIWNQAAINAMSGSSISWADGVTWSKISWSYATVQDADQGATVTDTDSSASATSVTITWPSSTDSDGIIVAAGVVNTATRGPIGFATGINSRLQYELADYAAGVGDGAGGGSLASSMAITSDEFASAAMGGFGLFFAGADNAAAVAAYMLNNWSD